MFYVPGLPFGFDLPSIRFQQVTVETSSVEIAVNSAQQAASNDLAAHEAATNPHPGYLTEAEGDAAYDPAGEAASEAAAAVASHVGDYHDAPAAPAAVTLGGSPHTYTNGGARPVMIVTQGGTVSAIEISHNGTDWIDAGVTAGCITLARGYRYRVTYAVDPTVTAVEL